MWQGVGDFPMVVFSSFVSHPSGVSKFGWEPLRFTDGCGLLYRSLAINCNKQGWDFREIQGKKTTNNEKTWAVINMEMTSWAYLVG